jgi:AcrR family transcriptional regulator
MSQEKIDLRVRRTQSTLQSALVELIEEKGFAAITIGDIAERAMINRSTFYKHYRDKYHLVESIFSKAIERLPQGLPSSGANSSGSAGDKSLQADALEAFVEMFKYFAANARLFRAMLSSDGSSWFQARLREVMAKITFKSWKRFDRQHPAKDEIAKQRPPIEVGAALSSNFVIGSLTWWLENDMRYSPEQMATWVHRIAHSGFFG